MYDNGLKQKEIKFELRIKYYKITKFKVIPLKRMYYPDFFQTWHKCKPYTGRSKLQKIDRAKVLVFTLCVRNSECFFLAACEILLT